MATVRSFTPSVRVRSAGSLRKARKGVQPALFENLEPRLFLSAGGVVQADALDTDADAGGTMTALLDAGPTASNLAYTINKNATFPFTKAIFTAAFSDPDHLSLALVEIASLPGNGTLMYKGQAVTDGQLITAAQLGSLSYVIAKGYDGADSFTWRASDGASFSNVATAEFVTTPEATIVSAGDATEDGTPSFFTVTLNHAALGDVKIILATAGHAVANRNYVKMPAFVTIQAGQTTGQVDLTPIEDGVAKGDLDVIEKIGPGRGYTIGQAGSASVLIVDEEPKISFTTASATVQLGSATGQVLVSRSGATDDDLTLTLTIGGTARGGKDYQALPKTVTIPAGSSSTTIAIVPLLNPTAEKTVTVTCRVDTRVFSLNPLAKSAVHYLEPAVVVPSAASLFRPAVAYTVGYQPDAVAVGDFNGDGKADLVAVNASSTLDPGTMSILLGKGDGTFQDAVNIATDIDPSAVVVGRFNDDAFDDIAVANYDSGSGGSVSVIDIFLGKGDGTFQPKTSFATPSTPKSIALADFNGDGYSDLAVASEEGENDQNLSIYLADGGGSGSFSANATYPAYWAEAVTAGDFDEDGNVDLAVINQQDAADQGNPTVAIFAGQGDGTFQAGASYPVGDGAASVTAVDLNGDEHLDLAVPCYNDSNVGILLGGGNGTFGARTNFGALLDPQGVATGDFDNDGQADLAIAEWGDSAVRVKLGNGAGGFRTIDEEEVDAGNGPAGIATADFNGDGRLDVAATDQQASTVSVLLGTGPTASNLAYMINKNATFPFTKAIFAGAFSDPNHLALAQVKIASLPTDGTLMYKGQAVTAGQVIPAAQLGSLSYVVAKGYDGADSFTWRACDGASYSAPATVEFVTTPEAAIFSGGNVTEGGAPGSFIVQLSHAALGDVKINLATAGHAVGGKNYAKMPTFVTITAGQTSAPVALTPIVDGVAKGDLDVIEKIGPGKGYTVWSGGAASALIVDDEPKISFTTPSASIQWGGNAGQVLVSRTGATGSDLVLTLVIGGTARNGVDYQLLPRTVTIPAGSSSTTIAIVPLLDPATVKAVTLSCRVDTKAFSLDPLVKSALVEILHG